MKTTLIIAPLLLVVLAAVLLVLGPLGDRTSKPHVEPDIGPDAPAPPSLEPTSSDAFLYGRVTTPAGAIYEGRLRFDEETLWSDFFNGYKAKNPWAEFVPAEHLTERVPIEIFGIRIASRMRRVELGRPFMVRFGDIAHIDVEGRDLRTTLWSGTVFDLDRFGADDIADGLRIWDSERGGVDLVEWQIRRLELLPPTISGPGYDDFPLSRPLRGSVTTRDGRRLEGRLVYDLDESETAETLDAPMGTTNHSVPFGRIASIQPSAGGSRVRLTLHDGEELRLERSGDLGDGNGGMLIFIDGSEQPAYVPWGDVDRIDLDPPPSPSLSPPPPGTPTPENGSATDGSRRATPGS